MSQIKLLEKVAIAFSNSDWIETGWVKYETGN